MSDPYLILHKVRGEPAFDIAIQMPMEDEVWWIIPTSGHRAYPYWHGDILSLNYNDPDYKEAIRQGPPDDWPDHYAINNSPIRHEPRGNSILDQLGLSKASKLVRRV